MGLMVGCGPPVVTYTEDDNPWVNQPPGIYRVRCLNAWEANGHHQVNDTPPPPRELKKPSEYNFCMSVDPGYGGDPTEGANDWEDQMRAACTAYCVSQNVNLMGMYNPQCSDGGWSEVKGTFNIFDKTWATCSDETLNLNYNLIETVLGLSDADAVEELPCDLSLNCEDYLDYVQKHAMGTTPYANVRETADVLMESITGESSVTLLGGSAQDVEGHAAYSAIACGEDACPFYLAQLDLDAVSSINVTLSYGSGPPISKTISGLSISLEKPTLGIWVPGSDNLIFPTGSLRMRIEATISGGTNNFGENGFYSFAYDVPNYVFGSVDGDLVISSSGTCIWGHGPSTRSSRRSDQARTRLRVSRGRV